MQGRKGETNRGRREEGGWRGPTGKRGTDGCRRAGGEEDGDKKKKGWMDMQGGTRRRDGGRERKFQERIEQTKGERTG